MVDILGFVVDITLKWLDIPSKSLNGDRFPPNMIYLNTWKCITLMLNEEIWNFPPAFCLTCISWEILYNSPAIINMRTFVVKCCKSAFRVFLRTFVVGIWSFLCGRYLLKPEWPPCKCNSTLCLGMNSTYLRNGPTCRHCVGQVSSPNGRPAKFPPLLEPALSTNPRAAGLSPWQKLDWIVTNKGRSQKKVLYLTSPIFVALKEEDGQLLLCSALIRRSWSLGQPQWGFNQRR